MKIHLILSPYDSGHFEARMGKGPGHFMKHGAVERLREKGHDVTVATVDPRQAFPTEVATGFAVMHSISELVKGAVTAGAFPLVLAGNCSTSVGTVSGLAPRRVGVVWFDAHGDSNTPETSSSGFLDGMGLAVLTGDCWQPLAETVPGFAPLPEEQVILAGARDFDDLEWKRLAASKVAYLSDQDLNDKDMSRKLGGALEDLAGRVDGIHLHIDLDVHDARVAPANHFDAPGGVTPARLREAVALVVESIPVLSAYMGAYDPDVDRDGATLASGFALMETILAGRRVRTAF